jgi:predicted nucleic acid-binding protein
MTRLLALLDSCVIFPMPLCDTLLRAGESDLYQLYYSQDILDGATRNLVKRGKMTPEKAKRFQKFIIDTFPEGLVEVPAGLDSIMTNHEGDRHVLAAAVAAKAEIIVTANIKHFKSEALKPWNIEAITPDDFLNRLCDLHGEEELCALIREQAADLINPPQTFLDIIGRLEKEQPLFTSRLLLCEYAKMIETVARKLNYIWFKCKELRVEGENYRINSSAVTLTVFCKSSNRTVIHISRDDISGKIYHRDVLNFQAIAEQLVKENMLRKSIIST